MQPGDLHDVDEYFSDRENGAPAQTQLDIGLEAWGGIHAEIQSRISDGSFAEDYPCNCQDGDDIAGTNRSGFEAAAIAEIPDLNWKYIAEECPATFVILDLVEFCYRHVTQPIKKWHHEYCRHMHLLSFDREQGRERFRTKINIIFQRNQLAYQLQSDGKIVRIVDPIVAELIEPHTVVSQESELDRLLDSARTMFLSRDSDMRRNALKELWDAWERLKTLDVSDDKKESVTMLLNSAASEPDFRKLLEDEAKALTNVGNNFLIRHSETNRTPLERNEQADYLFHRLFALISLLVHSRI